MGESFLGIILSSRILATALFSIPCAMIVDRWGKKRALLLGVFLVPITSMLQGYFQSTWSMLICAVIQGCAMAFLLVAEGPFFMENGTSKNRLKLFSYSFADNVFASMIGYFVFGHISEKLNISVGSLASLKYSIILSALIGLIACIFAVMIKDNKVAVGKAKSNFYNSAVSLIKEKDPIKFITYNFIIGLGAGLVVPYFNVYLKYKANASIDQIGIIMSLSQAAMGIGGLITPIMAQRHGKVKTIILCQIVSIPFLMLIAIPPSLIIVSLALFIRNTLMNMSVPIVNNMAMELVNEHQRPVFASINNISSNLSRALGAVIAGFIMKKFTNGYEIPYFITAIMYIVATVHFYKAFKNFDAKAS